MWHAFRRKCSVDRNCDCVANKYNETNYIYFCPQKKKYLNLILKIQNINKKIYINKKQKNINTQKTKFK